LELEEENTQTNREITTLNEEIEETLSYNSHLSEKLLTQAKRIMVNTFIRC